MKSTVLLRESLLNLRRYRDLTVQSVGILSIALYLLGIYFIVGTNVKSWLKNLEDKVEISCFLNYNVRESTIEKVRNNLKEKNNVLEVKYVSKNEALVNFVQDPEIGEQIKILGENPLPASFNIKLKNKNPHAVEEFVAEVRREYREVFEDITYGKEEVSNLSRAFSWIKFGGGILGTIFFLLIIVLLFFTLRIGRAERQEEIKTLLLMGSENEFLTRPFFYEGVLIGLVSFMLSLLILFLTYYLFDLRFRIDFISRNQAVLLFLLAVSIVYFCDFFVLRSTARNRQ